MSDLARVRELAELLVRQKQEVEDREEALAAAKQAMLRTEREDLPMLMAEVGLQEVTLNDGSKIAIVEDCDARITDATREGALSWLVNNGFGGIIKTNLTMSFGRGEREEALAVQRQLAASNHHAELKEEVHPSTLKAFVKEQLSSGSGIPMDLFNIYPYSKATLKKAK